MNEDEKVEGLGEPLPEEVIEAELSVVRKAMDDFIARKKMLGVTVFTMIEYAEMADAVEEALEASRQNEAIEAHPIRKLLDAVIQGAESGLVVGVAVATVGADKQTGQMFHCPTEQNVMAGAIGQLMWTFHMSRHMDMLSQQNARGGGIVRPGR
jgi:hypothetical protein